MSPRRRLVAFNISVTQQDGRYISGMTARPSPLWGTELPRRGQVIPASQSNALTGIATTTTTFVFIA